MPEDTRRGPLGTGTAAGAGPPAGRTGQGDGSAGAAVDAGATGTADACRSAVLRSRARVESLAAPDGGFAVACREDGVRPPPVTDLRFDSYADAERARDAAEDYRDAMRRLDPGLERYDLAVSEVWDAGAGFASVRETTGGRRTNGLPRTRRTVTVGGGGRDEWLRVENAPVVHLVGPDAPLDDEVIERQLRTALDPR